MDGKTLRAAIRAAREKRGDFPVAGENEAATESRRASDSSALPPESGSSTPKEP